jgi:hypothetical protein
MYDNLKCYILGLNSVYRSGKSTIDSLVCGEALNGRWESFYLSEDA